MLRREIRRLGRVICQVIQAPDRIFGIKVPNVVVVETSGLSKTSPIRVSPGSANVSGAFPGKPSARIVAQACPTGP